VPGRAARVPTNEHLIVRRREVRLESETSSRPGSSVLRLKSRWLILLAYGAAGSELAEVVGERGQDLVGGLGPGERPGIVVPGGYPVPDLVLQGLHRGVHAAADQLVGQQPEPPLDLVHPGRPG